MPTADVVPRPVTLYVDTGVIEPTALLAATPVTLVTPVINKVTSPTEVVAATPVMSTNVIGATIAVPIADVIATPVVPVVASPSKSTVPTELVRGKPVGVISTPCVVVTDPIAEVVDTPVTATDIDRRVLYSAMRTYPNVNFVHDDMCNSKITDMFDYVLDRGCYHWQEDKDRENYIKNLHRLCKKLLFLKIIVDKSCDQHKDLQHIQKHFGDYFTIMSTLDTEWSPTGTRPSQFLVLEPW